MPLGELPDLRPVAGGTANPEGLRPTSPDARTGLRATAGDAGFAVPYTEDNSARRPYFSFRTVGAEGTPTIRPPIPKKDNESRDIQLVSLKSKR
jgi:hypothetical protein